MPAISERGLLSLLRLIISTADLESMWYAIAFEDAASSPTGYGETLSWIALPGWLHPHAVRTECQPNRSNPHWRQRAESLDSTASVQPPFPRSLLHCGQSWVPAKEEGCV